MATINSRQVSKKNNHRGVYEGQEHEITAKILVADGTSIATSDLIKMVPLGENVRPSRLLLKATPVSGTPVLTNPTFNCGVIATRTTSLTRPNGDVYPVLTTSATALKAGLIIPVNNEIAEFSIPRPVANSVSKYGPFTVTLTPAGAGAFSVAGGDIELALTVVFETEGNITSVYNEFVNGKVKNA